MRVAMSDSAQLSYETPTSVWGLRSFVYYWCARTSTNAAYQMLVVAVGYQVYSLTDKPFDLALVGLVQFIPIVPLSLIIGQIADHYDRRMVVRTCQIVKALAAG